MSSLNFMFFCSLIEELCTKKESIKQVVTLILDMSVHILPLCNMRKISFGNFSLKTGNTIVYMI